MNFFVLYIKNMLKVWKVTPQANPNIILYNQRSFFETNVLINLRNTITLKNNSQKIYHKLRYITEHFK